MGALSFSPSPITTTPVIGTEPSTCRMASTAAWSTASLSPKPILRAAAMAAASVTRTSSRARLRSGASRSRRASIGHTSSSVPGTAVGPGDHFPRQRKFAHHQDHGIPRRSGWTYGDARTFFGGWHPGPRRLTLGAVAPALGRVRPPAVGPWCRRSHPVGAMGPLRLRPNRPLTEATVGGSHGHVHAPVPVAGSPGGADEGLRAVRLSAVGLGLTAAVQFAFVAASGSVALLADALHNLGDVFTTATLWIAFVVGRRQPDRDHTFGYARAEDVAGVLVVLAIAASAAVAAWESLDKLLGGEVPELRRPSWALGAALVGVVGNEAVAQYKIRVGRRVNSVPLEADGRHSRVGGMGRLAGRRPARGPAAVRGDRLGAGRVRPGRPGPAAGPGRRRGGRPDRARGRLGAGRRGRPRGPCPLGRPLPARHGPHRRRPGPAPARRPRAWRAGPPCHLPRRARRRRGRPAPGPGRARRP